MKPYEYNRIKALAFNLVNVYHSVNDKTTQEAVYATAANEILTILSNVPEAQDFLGKIKDSSLTADRAELALLALKPLVEPFSLMTESQIRKTFKKVKKLKLPAISLWDMREVSYFAWNEISSNRKYILTANGDGYYGTISGQFKNICAICKKTSTVTQFLATTKSGSDGTYTKNGTYICLDSDQCNRQIQSADGLENFLNIIKQR